MTLKGNSGCKLEANDDIVVKKAEGNYVPRLKAQMKKQLSFQGTVINGYSISAEPIVSYVNEDSVFSFFMPLDKGKTASEIIKNGYYIKDLSDVFINYLLSNMLPKRITNAKELIDNKLKSLEKTVPSEYVSHIKMFEKKLAPEIYAIQAGYCHGDFTLENILVNSGEKSIHLIDFLDSFLDSPLLDFATILQDTKCLWSYRYEIINEDQHKNIRIFNKIIENELKDIGIYRQVTILLLMKLYRILPYIKDDVTKEFLDVNIEKIEKELNVSNG